MRHFIALAAFLALSPVCANAQDTPATIDGRVVNSVTGEPVSAAVVRLTPWRGLRAHSPGARDTMQTTSGTGGAFHLENVPPGSWLVRVSRDGFSSARGRTPTPIDLTPGQSRSDLTLSLVPNAALRGTVVDENGKPLPGVNVFAITRYVAGAQSRWESRANAVSNTQGAFVLNSLAPGNYYLAAQPSATAPAPEASTTPAAASRESGILARSFYPNAPDLDQAAPIAITAGDTPAPVTFVLRRVFAHHLRGTVQDLSTSGRDQRVSVTLRSAPSLDALARTSAIARDGSFDIPDLPSGAYVVKLLAGGFMPLARQNIDIGAQDVNGIVLRPDSLVELTGSVSVEGSSGGALPGIQLLAATLESRRSSRIPIQPDGTFSLPGLLPAPTVFRTSVSTPGFYVKSLQLNQQDALNRAVDLSGQSRATLDVVLRSGTGEIDGTIQDDLNGALLALILLPEQLAPDGSNLVQHYARPDGTFALTNVPPGAYRLYCFAPEPWALQTVLWLTPQFLDAMQSYAVPLRLDENQRLSTRIGIIPPDILADSAQQLGFTIE